MLNFPSWYQYETILENSHLLVCRRPGYLLTMRDAQHQQWLDAHLTDNIEDLHSLPAGKIYLAETPWFDISATLIRERLQQGLDCDDPPLARAGLYPCARSVSEKYRCLSIAGEIVR